MNIEAEEGEEICGILDREMATHLELNNYMRNFMTNSLGNPGWERLVRARWLKKRQVHHDNDFDPE
jgi:hypothetical protein